MYKSNIFEKTVVVKPNGGKLIHQGHIIYLNGASSSDKSSIAKALQEILDGHYLHTGLDHFSQMLPEGFVVFYDGPAPTAFAQLGDRMMRQ